jgi:alkylation response protein AidB-like acyl-CoA dehydrogenase
VAAPLAPVLGGADLRSSAGGATATALLQLLRVLGRGSLPVGRLYEGHANALDLIQLYGTPAQVERWSADVRAGCRFGVWAAHDRELPLQLMPEPDGGGVLQGVKNFCSGSGFIERAVVTAAIAEGVHQLVVVAMDQEAERVDLAWWQPLGMRASATGRVDFSGLRVPREALLGAPGDYEREPHFRGGAVRFAAVHQGGAEGLFDAVRTLLRPQRHDPLLQQRMAELAIAVHTGALWIEAAARAWAEPQAAPLALADFADLVRSAILETCSRVLALVERSLGASAFMRPQPFERLVRDLTMYLRQPSPDRAFTSAGLAALDSLCPAADLWSLHGG